MRAERVADQIREEIASLLDYETKDPRIGFLTVTRVRVTPDLQAAHVHYTTLGDAAQRRETMRALERAGPFLRRQLASRLRLRHTPELRFHYDQAIEQQERVERLLQEIAAERAARPADRTDDDQAE
ncbi:MAG: 30S ribosome-binding factor RbfA [Luteitalea sp.]|nr:30S ribosome-binding factor RbfA [Luteitalea sp.]